MSPRRRVHRSWLGVAAVAGLALGLLGAAVAIRLFDLRGPIAGQLSALTGRSVRVDGRSSLLLLPAPGLRLRDVAVGVSPEGSWLEEARVGRLDVGLALWPLLQGRVEVRRLRVDDVSLVVGDASRGGTRDPAPGGGGTDWLDGIERLDVRDVDVRGTGARPSAGRLDELSLHRRGPRPHIAWKASGQLDRARFALSGEVDPRAPEDRARAVSLDGRVAGARVHGDGTWTDAADDPSVALELRVEARDLRTFSHLADSELPALGPVRATSRLSWGGGRLGIRELDLSVGTKESSWLEVTGQVADALGRSEYSLRLDFGFADALALRPWVRNPPDLGRVTGRATVHNRSGRTRVEEFTLEGGRQGVFEIDARGSFEHVEDVDGLDAHWDLRLRDLAVLGELVHRSLPPTAPFELSGRLTATRGQLSSRDVRGRLGETTFTGRLAGDFRGPDRPRLTADVEMPELHLVDVGVEPGLVGRTPEGAGASRSAPLFSDASLDLSPLAQADGTLRVRAGRVLGVGGELVSDVTLRASVEDRVLSLGPVKLGYAGGSIGIEGELDARGSPPAARLRASVQGARLERILAEIDAREAYSGRIDGGLDLHSRGDSPKAMASQLAGSIELAVVDGTIAVADAGILTRDLMRAVRPRERRRTKEPLRCLLVGFEFDRGVGTAAPLLLDSQDVVVAGGGTVDLATERIELRLVPKPRRASFFSTAFAVDVTGTLAAPAVKVDKVSAVTNTGRTFLKRAATLTQTERTWRILFRRGVDSSPCARALDPAGW